ncbi:MAG: hypothetical protein QOG77_1260, partial [Solirubrobacteraceae bacterium]|nr:hypothetical protein [Solirubrobacteraceae bacterium]
MEADSEPLLLGAGPSPVAASVRAAMAQPAPGPSDPAFTAVMDETQELLRVAFGSTARATFPVTGSSGAGMEAALANFVDAGDRVVCGVAGLGGERLAAAIARTGGDVVRVDGELGRALPQERLVEAMRDGCDALAIVHGEQRLTYREMETAARRMAATLRARGVGPERLVGLMVEPSVEGLVAMLGVLEAGGAYVPVDPGAPAARLRTIFADAGIELVLTQRRLAEQVPAG